MAEKIFARHMLNEKGEVGVPSVKPGDTGFARADLRFSHEYVTPMAAIFFEQYVGKDAKVNDPSSILFFRDHLTFLDEVISEEKKKLGLLDLATQLKLKQEDFAKKQGIRLHGELTDRKGSEGICHSIVLETYALPGQMNVGSDSHTPHVGRDRLRRLWHRHHRRFQFLDHERCSRQSAGVGEDRHSRQAASERHRERFHPEDSEPGLRPQRQGAGQSDGVRRRGDRGA